MNDDPRPPEDNGFEPLEFLNKEPHDMPDQPPRDDYEDERLDDERLEDADLEDSDLVDGPPPARRRGLATSGGTNRVMIAAGVVVVAAALWVFWPRGGGGGDLPAPVGEQMSVVEADSDAVDVPMQARPRSSDVNLAAEAPAVVPEQPAEGSGQPAAQPARTVPRPANSDGEPSNEGVWAIQLGSFGTRANAQELAVKLRAKGFRVETPTLQSTTGGESTKVWIAYFRTHAEAKTWAAAHESGIGKSTYITHR